MDHREIGQKLGLFQFSELSPGCPIWLPKGVRVYNALLARIRKLNEANNHNEIRTPLIWKPELYKISGHLEHYEKNMFSVDTGNEPCNVQDMWLKPMNCPGHMEVFRSQQWSYQDLPFGFAEYSPLHRNESSGSLGGLTRCRCFCQDDAHVFCSPETLRDEIKRIISMVHEVYTNWFGMSYSAALSTRPDKFMGDESVWDGAEDALKEELTAAGLNYHIAIGDGAFYGPKIDFTVKDALGRLWQTATIQLDFQLPERFDLEYIDSDSRPKRPIVIHRAIFGSFERFIAIILESLNGKLPLWLAPIGVRVLPISEKQKEYADKVAQKCRGSGVYVDVDSSNNTLSQRILRAHEECIPKIVVVGNRESHSNTISLREETDVVKDLAAFVEDLKEEYYE